MGEDKPFIIRRIPEEKGQSLQEKTRQDETVIIEVSRNEKTNSMARKKKKKKKEGQWRETKFV